MYYYSHRDFEFRKIRYSSLDLDSTVVANEEVRRVLHPRASYNHDTVVEIMSSTMEERYTPTRISRARGFLFFGLRRLEMWLHESTEQPFLALVYSHLPREGPREQPTKREAPEFLLFPESWRN